MIQSLQLSTSAIFFFFYLTSSTDDSKYSYKIQKMVKIFFVVLLIWQMIYPYLQDGSKSHNLPEREDEILDISSGILHLAGGSLVPDSISKEHLESAKVLPQLDRKFIPVVADGILAIIDQVCSSFLLFFYFILKFARCFILFIQMHFLVLRSSFMIIKRAVACLPEALICGFACLILKIRF